MAGFPNRPSRTAFGPHREDERPVQNPERELGAQEMNLDFWQVAGMGLTVPRVVLIVNVSGAAIVLPHSYQGIAWDPKGQLPNIPVQYNALGDYELNLSSTYLDELGNPISTALKGGKVSAQSALNINGVVFLNNPLTAVIHLFDAATGNPIDSNFLLELW